MPREPKCRRVAFEPVVNYFKPQGVEPSSIEEVTLKIEELEAIRLKNYLALEQEEGAIMMGVSRPTFQRILTEANAKVAEALITGKALRIEGGNYCLGHGYCRKHSCSLSEPEICSFPQSLSSVKMNVKKRSRIAICALGEHPHSLVAEHFGRCSFFVIWDPEQSSYYALPNTYADSHQGAGTSSARGLISAGVGTIITNKIGRKSFVTMQRSEITIYADTEDSTVENTLNKYLEHKLPELEESNR